jgi:hypothetical protein
MGIPGEYSWPRRGAGVEIDRFGLPARQIGRISIHKWVFSET